ncbi:hypothetical protein POM88_006856 [Heracleum sosnowskyi]|uniref:Uncharacterized protein n=1 Tax=Heracleum sosnowskyi TaxID=360622 RepID=A0AAD8N6W8_9APIA|nr:hypothetical protein POM88_006856 [Heracleum sosnowskyi]
MKNKSLSWGSIRVQFGDLGLQFVDSRASICFARVYDFMYSYRWNHARRLYLLYRENSVQSREVTIENLWGTATSNGCVPSSVPQSNLHRTECHHEEIPHAYLFKR